MLQSIRDRSQGLVVGVIVFFICLTFALFGVQQYLDAKGSVVVAEVNGEEISLTEFQRTFQQLRQRAQGMLGESFNPDQWSGAEAKQSTLDYVVNERLLQQAANRSNIRASNQQVATYIRSSAQFQQDGAFSQDLYTGMVRSIGFSELGFEQQVRKDIVANQLRAGVGASAFTTENELQRIEQYRRQTRDVGYAVLGIEAFRDDKEPSAQEIESYFGERSEDYRIEEKVVVAYLDLSIESLMKEVSTNDAQLRAYYAENQANYTTQEQRNANHILIQLGRDASPEEEDTARIKAVALRERAVGGESFADIARENSDDIGSRTDGGETGFFGRGVMAPEFEEAVFAMTEGEVSEPIRTEFGIHVIKLKAVKPGGLKEFEQAKADVEAAYQRERAEELFYEQTEQLTELVYEQPDALDAAADAVGLEPKVSEALSRNELAALFSPKVVEATFEPEVLLEGLNSAPIDVNNGRVVVVRVSEHFPSTVPSLDKVRDEVKLDLVDSLAREAVDAHGAKLVERLKAGEELQSVMAGEELTWEDVPGATRDSPKLNRAVARAAFQADVANDREFIGVPIGIGDYAVVAVSNLTMPPSEELNKSDINELRRELSNERAASSWRDFVALLKADSDVKEFSERL